jgi:hypothetical protein
MAMARAESNSISQSSKNIALAGVCYIAKGLLKNNWMPLL